MKLQISVDGKVWEPVALERLADRLGATPAPLYIRRLLDMDPPYNERLAAAATIAGVRDEISVGYKSQDAKAAPPKPEAMFRGFGGVRNGQIRIDVNKDRASIEFGKVDYARVCSTGPNQFPPGTAAATPVGASCELNLGRMWPMLDLDMDRARELRDALIALFDRLDEVAGTKPASKPL